MGSWRDPPPTSGPSASQAVLYNGSGSAVTANPNPGYHFTGWSDGVLTAARIDSGVGADLFVSAGFAIDTYQLHFSVAAHGTLSGDASQTVSYGGSGSTVNAVADDGYHFDRWSDGVLTAARTDTAVHGPITASATFAINTYKLLYSAGAGGTIIGSADQTVDYLGSGSKVTASPNAGYHFVGWNDGVTTAARTDIGITRAIDVTADFAPDVVGSFRLFYAAGPGGTISGTTPQTVTLHGSGTAVTAVPNPGYHFVKWSDDYPTAARTEADVTADKSVSAIFAVDTFQLRYSAGVGGTISGTTSQTVPYDGSGTAVTAIPAAGFHFQEWSDYVTSAERTDGGVTHAITATALFQNGDQAPPATSWPGQAATFVSKVTISLVATDNGGTGVLGIRYRLDSGRDTTYTVPFTTTKAGARSLDYWSVDNAGNVEPRHHVHFTVLMGTYVSITSNHTSITHKHPVVFSGHISTTQPTNTHVYVYVKRPGSKTWSYLSTRHTTSTHHWSYSCAPSYKGTWYFMVKFKGTSRYAASHSVERRITVR